MQSYAIRMAERDSMCCLADYPRITVNPTLGALLFDVLLRLSFGKKYIKMIDTNQT